MMLRRILVEHPNVQAIVPASRSSAGTPVVEADPGMSRHHGKFAVTDGRFVSPADAAGMEVDLVFSALPHGTAAEAVAPFAGRIPVIDLSADFRFRDAELYASTYGKPHPLPDLLGGAVYGLTEWHRDAVKRADIIACPGCYPTSTLLPLLPFAEVLTGTVVVNALSGISGAGRKETRNLLFNERSENAAAYSPGRTHRHVAEMVQELPGLDATLLFTPHLIPMKQGMLASVVVTPREPMSQHDAEERIRSSYADSPFVGLSSRAMPETRDVRNTNRCDISVTADGEYLYLFSVIDNLYKGAAGQAVQNMNVRCGFPETAGLRLAGEF
jgi:N-acetyl-gamma-glutamyl-phosphate reductase